MNTVLGVELETKRDSKSPGLEPYATMKLTSSHNPYATHKFAQFWINLNNLFCLIIYPIVIGYMFM